MNAAVTPLIGRTAAASLRSTPTPASTRNTFCPTTIAVAGPHTSGCGRGVPVPSITISVFLAAALGGVCGKVILDTRAKKKTATEIFSTNDFVIPQLLTVECYSRHNARVEPPPTPT